MKATPLLAVGACALGIAVAVSIVVGFDDAARRDPVIAAAGDIACGSSRARNEREGFQNQGSRCRAMEIE